MSTQYQVRSWRVDVDALTLIGPEGRVALEPRTMALLEHFCRHPGVTLGKDALLDAVWGSEHFTDSVVTRAVSLLRSSLGDSPDASLYIQTVPRRGYRFVAPVALVSPGEPAKELPAAAGATKHPPRRWPWVAAALAVSALAYFALGGSGSAPDKAALAPLESVAITPFAFEDATEPTAFPLAGLQVDLASQLARLKTPRVFLVDEAPRIDAPRAWDRMPAVDGVLTGRAFSRDGELVVELRLLGVASRELVWSSEYRVDRSRTFATREDMVRDLATLSRTGLARWDARAQREHVDSEAYETYLEALWMWRERSFDSLAEGQRLFERAIAIDPSFADAHAGLALSYVARVSYGREDRDAGYAAATAAAERALTLDPENPWALTARGQLAMQRDWDFEGAVSWFSRAVQASPSAVDARQYLAEVYSITGRHREALGAIEDALVLRSDTALLRAIKGMVQTAAGEYAGAIATFEALDGTQPRFDWYHWYWSFAVHRLGEPITAAKLRARRFAGRIHADALRDLMAKIDAEGPDAFWRWQRSRLAPLDTRHVAIHAVLLAEAEAALGDLDAALAGTRTAIALRGEAFPMFRISPAFDALRGREDFQSALRDSGLPPSTTR